VIFALPSQRVSLSRKLNEPRCYTRQIGAFNDEKDQRSPPYASATPADMLYPQDGTAFDMLSRFIEYEYVNPADMEMRGDLAALGIVKGKPFSPDAATRDLLDQAAKTASRMGHVIAYQGMPMISNFFYYPDRHWINPFPGNATFTADTYRIIDERIGYFTYAYALSPGMAVNMENIGAKYPAAYVDADGDFLRGEQVYMLHLPPKIPAAIFWSVAVYDPITGSGLDNGQPFPSLNTMDKPIMNADGSTDIYFGPKSPGDGLVYALPAVWSEEGVLRSDMATGGHQEGQIVLATPRKGGVPNISATDDRTKEVRSSCRKM
jgi:hypothetical protein